MSLAGAQQTAHPETIGQPGNEIEDRPSAPLLPAQADNILLCFTRHSLAFGLPLLAAVLLLTLINNLDYLVAAILVGPQWGAAILLLLAGALYPGGSHGAGSWKLLGVGFLLGGAMQAGLYLLLLVPDNAWYLLDRPWSLLVFSFWLAAAFALLQARVLHRPGGLSRKLLAGWVGVVILGGTLIGAVLAWFMADMQWYSGYVVAWGVLFGLVNAGALRWLEMRRA